MLFLLQRLGVGLGKEEKIFYFVAYYFVNGVKAFRIAVLLMILYLL